MGTILKEYETMFVINPELTDDQSEKLLGRVKEVIAKQDGEFLRDDAWGKRRMAFRAKKQVRGGYHFFQYVAKPGAVSEVERFLRNSEHVIRFLTTTEGEVKDLEAKKAEVERLIRERAAREEAAAAAAASEAAAAESQSAERSAES